MTTISKVLVVCTVAASLAFMGFVAVIAVGGPNWEAERHELPDDYIFERSEGEVVTWSVKARRSGDSVASGAKSLAEAVVAARKHLKADQKEKVAVLDQELPLVQDRLDEAILFIEVDLKAMDKREAELLKQLHDLNDQIKKVSDAGEKKSQDAIATQVKAKNRRQDQLRLKNLHAEVRTDLARAVSQRDKLEDSLIRARGKIERLERRKKQLIDAGAKIEYE